MPPSFFENKRIALERFEKLFLEAINHLDKNRVMKTLQYQKRQKAKNISFTC